MFVIKGIGISCSVVHPALWHVLLFNQVVGNDWFFGHFQSKISLEGLEDKSMDVQPPLPPKGDPSKYSEIKGQLGTSEGIVAWSVIYFY